MMVREIFITGSKFGEIHLHDLTLASQTVPDSKIEILEVVHLNLHNVDFDQSVMNSLQANGCPYEIYVSFHVNHIQLDVQGTTSQIQKTRISMPDVPPEPHVR
jgi:hypothetical protein